MAEKKRIYPGTDLKLKVTFLDEDFDPAANDWAVEIQNEYGQKAGMITKEESLIDTEGNFYITVRTQAGKFLAKTTYLLPDTDYGTGYGQKTDIQTLYDTGCGCLPRLKPVCCEQETEHRVIFEEVNLRNVDDLYILLDRDGEPILDRDGNAILVRKFKNEP